MIEHFRDIQERLRDIHAEQLRHGETLAAQEANLREHMRRTALLEEHVSDFRAEVDARLQPVQAHVGHMRFAFRLVVWVGTAAAGLIGAAVGVAKLLEYIQGP